MPLKKKGKQNISGRKAAVPKAGPKKRRAKSEEEMIRAAVEEHGRRGVRARRKASNVHTYSFKEVETAKHKKAEAFLTEQERVFAMRLPQGPSPFVEFVSDLSDEERIFASAYWHMQCEHRNEKPQMIDPSFVNGVTPVTMECPDCGLVRRWHGTRTETKLQEWMSYCPNGYDMFDWQDMFVRDRSMWRFIHDEVLADMVDDSMKEESE